MATALLSEADYENDFDLDDDDIEDFRYSFLL